MRGNETPGRIVTNIFTGVGVHDVITSANIYDCRLWGLSVVGVNFWICPLTRVVALTHTTLFAIKGSNNKKQTKQRKRSEINHCKISQTQQDNTIRY